VFPISVILLLGRTT